MERDSFLKERSTQGTIDFPCPFVSSRVRSPNVSRHSLRMRMIMPMCHIIKRLLMLGYAAFIPLSLLLAVASPSYGSAISFDPIGAQLDGDPILDISTVPEAVLTFNMFYDSSQSESL
jgi:hypothetical protein